MVPDISSLSLEDKKDLFGVLLAYLDNEEISTILKDNLDEEEIDDLKDQL